MTLTRTLASLVALGSATALAACGGSGSTAKEKPPAPTAADARFDPANFDEPATGRNPYLPVAPGTQWVREGSTLVGKRRIPHQVTTTVTDVYRRIAGVKTVAMLDYEIDGGQVAQVSIDWAAEDKRGNLWLVGGYTEGYEGGRFVSAMDAWLAGVRGAKAGIVVQGDPKVGTPEYAVAQPDSEEGDVAQVVKKGIRRCVPFKCFNDVLVVREGKASAPDNELKYYARNVGQIDNVPRGASVHKDVERLINVTRLSPRGLREASAEALRADRHAPQTSPKTFKGRPLAKRG